jgi:AraC family transcriptional regulator of adaptative response / DNA-3-methyladenine glycosylase II
MVAMRGAGDPDAFPPKDLGLVKAWEHLIPAQKRDQRSFLEEQTRLWRPWRSYAANLLWRSYSQ